tara:strand:+ start:341 stop:1501 length:1161 start_codon:yes stop_codon:yes gene_type:complete
MIRGFFKIVKKLFLILKNINYTLNYPPKKKILLFDENLKFYFLKYFKTDYEILHTRNLNYNLIVILKALLKYKFKFSLLNYFNLYVKFVNPKIVLTFTDNHPFFWRLEVAKNTKKIFLQAAQRTETKEDVFFYKKKFVESKKKNFVDYMFVFNKKIGKIYSSFIEGKYIIIGSVKSNAFRILKNKKKFDLLFISTWRDHPENLKVTQNLKWKTLLDKHSKVLTRIKNYAIENKKILTIYGCSDDPKEREFFSNILGKTRWKFLKNNRMKTYRYVDNAKIVISTLSTLGIETCARKSKLAVINPLKLDKLSISRKFAWPYKLKKEGPFWTSDISQKSINKLLTRVDAYQNHKWEKLKKKYLKDCIVYDPNNKTYVELIKRILNKNQA